MIARHHGIQRWEVKDLPIVERNRTLFILQMERAAKRRDMVKTIGALFG